MNKKIVGVLSVGIALSVPALVLAQVARFTENEPLTVARMDQIVNAINNINFSTPVQLPAINGSTTGGPTTRTFTAQSPGILLLVPAGTGFRDIDALLSTETTTGRFTIARSNGGHSLTIPMGTGQALNLSFTNATGESPDMNAYFTSLTGGAAPLLTN